MSSRKGGILILSVAIFGAGYLAAPEVRTVTETKTDIVTVRIPDTHVIKDTKVVTEDLPESCVKFIQKAEALDAANSNYSKALSPAADLVGDGRSAIVTDDVVGTVEVVEGLALVSTEISAQTRVIAQSITEMTEQLKECKADTKK